MKQFFLFLILIFFARGSTLAQSDTMIVENGSTIKKYPVSDVDWITFKVQTVGVKEDGESILTPTEFSISQNYPNPFNPVTKIQFQLPAAGVVTVNIYDINGRLVKELFSGEKEAGRYTLGWNAKGLNGMQVASGVYFYSVQFNNTLLTKKMIYLK